MEKLVIYFPAAIEGKPGTGWSLIGSVLYLGYANEGKVLRLNAEQARAVSEIAGRIFRRFVPVQFSTPNAPYF